MIDGVQAPSVRMWAGWAAEALCGGNRLALSCFLCGRAQSLFLLGANRGGWQK